MAEILEIEVRAKGAKETANELDKIAESIKKISNSNGINSLTPKIKSATKEANKFSNVLSGKLLKSLERIAFYRLMRTIVKSITDALKEGLKNAYLFSKSINGGLAQALDSLASKSLTMKNSLGAAFGELIQTITPMLIKLMNFAIKVANVISQLFAILGGRSTWLKATESTAKYADEAKNAAGATKEWKNQLMGFDEINKLEDQSGGGSGSGTNIGNWDSQLAPVNEKLKYIWDLVKAIGLGLLGWKLAKAFGGSLQQCIGWALILAGAFLTINGYLDMWKNGISAESLTETMIGIGLLAVGLTLAFGQTAGAIALLVGGVALIVIGMKEWIQTGQITNETLVAIVAGLLLVGIALALLGQPWALVAAAAVAAGVIIYAKWDEIKTFFMTLGEYLKSQFCGAWDVITGVITGDTEKIASGMESMGRTWSEISEEIKSKLKDTADETSSSANEMVSNLTNATNDIKSLGGQDFTLFNIKGTDSVNELLSNVSGAMPQVASTVSENTGDMVATSSEDFLTIDSNLKDSLESMNSSANSGLTDLNNLFATKMKAIASTIKSNIDTATTSVKNGIKKMQSAADSCYLAIHGSYPVFSVSLKSVAGTSVPKVTKSMVYFAKGGVVDSATLFGGNNIVGEHGAEAIVPLENNTEWITKVANKMVGALGSSNYDSGSDDVTNAVYAMANMVVNAINNKDMDVSLDGMSLARKMYKYNSKVTNEHGMSLINA